jgi:hypothetical protein
MFKTGSFSGILTIVLLCCTFHAARSQQLSNLRRVSLAFIPGDTLTVDTLSIVPGSFDVFDLNGSSLKGLNWIEVNYPESKIIFHQPMEIQAPDSVTLLYRVFPFSFSRPAYNRDRSVIEKGYSGLYNPYTYEQQVGRESFFKTEGLNKNGNISRGISFGNNQDVVVNSSFNLQLSGKLSDDVEILAAITDNNIPVQPEGNTQQIQDFDQVFIRLSKNKTSLLAGDFEIGRPQSHFLNYFKKAQGGLFASEYPVSSNNSALMSTQAAGAISKGKYARNVINGVEANQGPYKLTGSENETFIIVLSNSEKVYVDGMLLKRGENFDYVIDYNTAEVTFMPTVQITKDKRIVVEFQYSDKNYSRTMFLVNQGYKSEKLKLNASIYSEQDNRNQPLTQDLSESDKQILADAGDSLSQAVVPNIDSVEFDADQVLYARTDSLGFDPVYVYSIDSTKAFYRLGFTYLGPNKGNYLPESTSANGRVYKWVVPVNGIPQGTYEPVVQLISPKRQRMITLGGEYQVDTKNKIEFEGAYSNRDNNLFSNKDKLNDDGYAFFGGYTNTFSLAKDSSRSIDLVTSLRFEHLSENFNFIEVYRNIEFTRDWNLGAGEYVGEENLGGVTLALENGSKYKFAYTLRTFTKGSDYTGIMNNLNLNYDDSKFRVLSNASYLTSDALNTNTEFLRSLSDISRGFGKVRLGFILDQENNEIRDSDSDSLNSTSYAYAKGQVYLSSDNESKVSYRLDAGRRVDWKASVDNLKEVTVADELAGKVEWRASRKSMLRFTSNYRNLTISDTALISIKPEESFLGRLEYNAVILKGMITSQTTYEVGTGQELKREYAFVEVAPGTGTHTYAGDYNGNGVKDLDEFEIAAFADQADYVKVFLPTNEYVKSRTNLFGQVLNINPSAFLKPDNSLNKALGRFSNTTSFRIDNKTVDEEFSKSLNPFANRLADSTLLATNSLFRNTLAFNRSNTTFGLDYTFLDNSSKSILTNGFESRQLRNNITNTRWNITKVYTIQLKNEIGTKSNRSEFFSTRDYVIDFTELEPKFSIQPGVVFRVTVLYNHLTKKNTIGEEGERTEQNTGGIELKYSSVKRGIISARFNLIRIDYNAESNTAIAYEMLDGLSKGTNYTWGLSFQRNLSNNIQINLNYDGRKAEGTAPVHIGSVQARAYF